LRTYRIDFMAWRHVATGLSAFLVILALAGLILRGLNLGIEFTGGALFEVEFRAPVALEQVRAQLADAGFRDAVVQRSGSDREILIRVPAPETVDTGSVADDLLHVMARVQAEPRMVSSEVIGPAVGGELRDSAGLAALVAFGAVGLYIMFRFAGKFAVGATAALVHDVVVTLGATIALGLTFDLPAFAAVLAIIGYSINDTIVIYDRIRENLRLLRSATPVQAINLSLNQTLERTLAMSATTLFTLIALLVFGGPALRGFSATMAVGVVVGTYSSIYVASSLLLTMKVDRTSLLIPESVDDVRNP